MILYKFTDGCGFLAGDTETGRVGYAYPTSHYASRARLYPHQMKDVAAEMTAAAWPPTNAEMLLRDADWMRDLIEANAEQIMDAFGQAIDTWNTDRTLPPSNLTAIAAVAAKAPAAVARRGRKIQEQIAKKSAAAPNTPGVQEAGQEPTP